MRKIYFKALSIGLCLLLFISSNILFGQDITINAVGPTANIPFVDAGGVRTYTPTMAATLTVADLEASLNLAGITRVVIISPAAGTITVADPINYIGAALKTLEIKATAGSVNVGATITATTGLNINIEGTTAADIETVNILTAGVISCANGNVSLTGRNTNGGATARAVLIQAAITATGAGTITAVGESVGTVVTVRIDVPISSVNGNISLTGTNRNTSAANNVRGVLSNPAGTITTTGTGSVIIAGTTEGNSEGVRVIGAINANGSGNISINGTNTYIDPAGTGQGVLTDAAGTLTTTGGAGTISVTGTTRGNAAAVQIGGVINSVSGAITLNGTNTNPAGGANAHGVWTLAAINNLVGNVGAVSITGTTTGNAAAVEINQPINSANGIAINGTNTLPAGGTLARGVWTQATGTLTTGGAGTITVTGTTRGDVQAVLIGQPINSANGITINGTNTNPAGNIALGVSTTGTGILTATGPGAISITGNSAGNAGAVNIGAAILSTAAGGNITLNGTNMNTGGAAQGVFVFGAITTNGLGIIRITGNSAGNRAAVEILEATQSANGAIILNGTNTNTTGINAHGVLITALVSTTGTGNLSILGNSTSANTAAFGIRSSSPIQTVAGNIDLTSNNNGIYFIFGASTIRSSGGTISLCVPTGKPIQIDGINAGESIRTTGGAAIQINGGLPSFVVGDANTNGTAGAISNGTATIPITTLLTAPYSNGTTYANGTIRYAANSLVATPLVALAEGNLNGAFITLDLIGCSVSAFPAPLTDNSFTLLGFPTGTSIRPGTVIRVNNFQATIILNFDGTDFDANITTARINLVSAALQSNNLSISANQDTESIALSGTAATEGSENNSNVIVTLTGGTFTNPINPTNWIVTNLPVGVTVNTITRNSSTQATINLSGNRTRDYDVNITNLTVTVPLADYADNTVIGTGAALIANTGFTFIALNDAEIITLSGTANEGNENGRIVTVTLTGGQFATAITPAAWTLANLPEGVTAGSIIRNSNTQVTITLSGNRTRDYDVNITNLTVTVPFADYADNTGGAALIANTGFTFTALNDAESITISGTANEGNENGRIVTVTLTGGQFTSPINPATWTFANLPVGVTVPVGNIVRDSDTQVTITLSGNRTGDYEGNITNLTVTVPLADYADNTGGAALTANTGFTFIAANPNIPFIIAKAGNRQVTLFWSADLNAAGYEIYMYAANLAQTLVGTTGETTFTVTGLQNTVAYFFRVVAVGSSGEKSGFSNTVSARPSVILSTEEEATSNAFKVYPNPSNGNLNLFIGELKGKNAEINVLDMTGRVVFNQAISANGNLETELNLNLANGMYLLQVSTEKENLKRKIIVQK